MSYSCLAQAIIPITQGSDYKDTVQINQDSGAPMDLTGYTVRSQLRRANGELAATFACSVPALSGRKPQHRHPPEIPASAARSSNGPGRFWRRGFKIRSKPSNRSRTRFWSWTRTSRRA